MFGQMTVTYSNGMATSSFSGVTGSFRYRVVKRGGDFVIIRYDAPIDKGRDIRIRFVDGDKGYWIHSPLGVDERFDKVEAR